MFLFVVSRYLITSMAQCNFFWRKRLIYLFHFELLFFEALCCTEALWVSPIFLDFLYLKLGCRVCKAKLEWGSGIGGMPKITIGITRLKNAFEDPPLCSLKCPNSDMMISRTPKRYPVVSLWFKISIVLSKFRLGRGLSPPRLQSSRFFLKIGKRNRKNEA